MGERRSTVRSGSPCLLSMSSRRCGSQQAVWALRARLRIFSPSQSQTMDATLDGVATSSPFIHAEALVSGPRQVCDEFKPLRSRCASRRGLIRRLPPRVSAGGG